MRSGPAAGLFSYLCFFMVMVNDPELDGKYLGTISRDFVKASDTLKESSYQIRKAGFAHPIFPIAKGPVSIGQLLLAREDMGLEWNYYASFLGEFIERELVASEKEDAFKSSYKDPDEFCCLFVVDHNFTKFVYIPYPVD